MHEEQSSQTANLVRGSDGRILDKMAVAFSENEQLNVDFSIEPIIHQHDRQGGAVAEWSKPFGLSHTIRRYPRFMGSNPGCGRVLGRSSLLGTLPVIWKIETTGLPLMPIVRLAGWGSKKNFFKNIYCFQ